MEEKRLNKFNKAFKALATIGLAAAMAVGASFLVACFDFDKPVTTKPPITQVDPPKDQPENPPEEKPENPPEEKPENPPEEKPENPPEEKPDDPPAKEEFKITAENIEEVKQAMLPHIEILCNKSSKEATLQNVYNVYLTKSEGSSVVDTIGAVFTIKRSTGTIFLKWGELTIPTQEDITYEKIYNNELVYSASSYDSKFSFSVGNESQRKEMVETLKSQTFGADYESADWTGWYGSQGASIDSHKLVMLKDGVIYEIGYGIYNNNQQLGVAEAVEANFKGKEVSKTTYFIGDENTYNIVNENRIILTIEDDETEQGI